MAKLSRTAFARLISSLSSITQSDFTDYQINCIDDLVTFEEPAKLSDILPAPKASAVDVDSLLAAFKAGTRIEAIKAYRTLTGYGLKESKDAVESYWVPKPSVTAPEFKANLLQKVSEAVHNKDNLLYNMIIHDIGTVRDFINSFDAGD